MANEVIPETLRRRYIDSFPAKAAAIEAACGALTSGGDPQPVRALRDLAHKLAGSAGMYGFDDLGQLARELVHAVDAGAGSSVLVALSRDLIGRLTGARAALEI